MAEAEALSEALKVRYSSTTAVATRTFLKVSPSSCPTCVLSCVCGSQEELRRQPRRDLLQGIRTPVGMGGRSSEQLR